MTTRNSTLVGVFDERAQAEQAIEQLHNQGVPDNQITYSGSAAGAGVALSPTSRAFLQVRMQVQMPIRCSMI